MFRFGICLKGLFYFITLGGGCGSPSSTEVATRRGAREFRLAPTKLISHEILMISQDLTSDVFFFGGESLHLHPLPITIFLELIDSIAPLRSRNTSSWIALLIPFASFFWMDGLFVLPPIFCCFVGATFFASPRHCPRSRSPMISVAAFHGEFN